MKLDRMFDTTPTRKHPFNFQNKTAHLDIRLYLMQLNQQTIIIRGSRPWVNSSEVSSTRCLRRSSSWRRKTTDSVITPGNPLSHNTSCPVVLHSENATDGCWQMKEHWAKPLRQKILFSTNPWLPCCGGGLRYWSLNIITEEKIFFKGGGYTRFSFNCRKLVC